MAPMVWKQPYSEAGGGAGPAATAPCRQGVSRGTKPALVSRVFSPKLAARLLPPLEHHFRSEEDFLTI